MSQITESWLMPKLIFKLSKWNRKPATGYLSMQLWHIGYGKHFQFCLLYSTFREMAPVIVSVSCTYNKVLSPEGFSFICKVSLSDKPEFTGRCWLNFSSETIQEGLDLKPDFFLNFLFRLLVNYPCLSGRTTNFTLYKCQKSLVATLNT